MTMSARMNDPVIVSAVRTPTGRRNGALADTHPADLLGAGQLAVLDRAGVTPTDVDRILAGCVTQTGEQSYNIARTAALAAGFPAEVPASTIDAQCGSSLEAISTAAALVRSGQAGLVLACGVESMSRVPLGTAIRNGPGDPFSAAYRKAYEVTSAGEAADRIAAAWSIDRRRCDEFGLRSQQRAASATAEGRFAAEILPLSLADGGTLSHDEGIRESSLDRLAELQPAFGADGVHTAGTSSQISDAAAAVLVASRQTAELHGLTPLARIEHSIVLGVDPVLKLTGPIPATKALLEQGGMAVTDVDLYEVSEAFAAVVLAWQQELSAPDDRLNVNGEAIALGHPVGASGARLMVTLLHELRRRGQETGVVAMCCGGGLGMATLIRLE